MLEQIRAVIDGNAPLPPVAKLLGMRIVTASEGVVEMALEVDERFANPMGTLHGGILCDLGDAAMGTAMATMGQAGESYTTIQLSCNFLRPVWRATLTARARVVHRGRTIGMSECEIIDGDERLIAKLSSTLMVLRGDAAKRR